MQCLAQRCTYGRLARPRPMQAVLVPGRVLRGQSQQQTWLLRAQQQESNTSLTGSSVSDVGSEEQAGDLGIRLAPGTPIYSIAVDDLHPTQLSVGMQQVQDKMKKLEKKMRKGPEALDKFLQSNPVPVVLGPGDTHYLIDHHHLARAMHELGITTCFAGTVRDYHELTPEQFWVAMADHNYLWLYKNDGSTVELQDLPKLLPSTVAGLADDPYRSLAALVRKAGGYQKSTKPFSEFIWANYLRSRVPMVIMAASDVESYVDNGIYQAMQPDASELPGYSPVDVAATE